MVIYFSNMSMLDTLSTHMSIQCFDTLSKPYLFLSYKFSDLPFHHFYVHSQTFVESDVGMSFIYLASPQGQGHHNSVSQLLWARIT